MGKCEDTLLIVDGHNLLFQMFYGMPSRIVNQAGKPIQGIIGFVGALIKIIKQVNPNYAVVLFDGQQPNKRTDILAEYKENRIDYSLVEEAENPFSQLPDIYRALEFMGIKYCEVDAVETDDVIAGYVHSYGNELQIVISSWDSDFFQLISDNVKILRYRGKNTIICDMEYIVSKFAIRPELYADFKSLVGDRADNIKGAEKIGVKTAGQLLHQFGSLKDILNNADSIEKKSVRESIIRNSERLLMNYEVIRLDGEAGIPFEAEEIRYTYSGLRTVEVLTGIGVR